MTEVIEMLMIILIVALCFIMIPFNSRPSAVLESRRKFDIFVRLYDKPYRYDVREYDYRFQIFRSSLSRIQKLNERQTGPDSPDQGGAIYGVTQYADLTDREFIAQHLADLLAAEEQAVDGGGPPGVMPGVSLPPLYKKYVIESRSAEMKNDIIFSRARRELKLPSNLPLAVDWREKGVIVPVKSQGSCGASWAISVVDTIAALVAIKRIDRQPAVDLCHEQVIRCAANGNNGCTGGDPCRLLEWLQDERFHIGVADHCPYRAMADSEQNCTLPGLAASTWDAAYKGTVVQSFSCQRFENEEHRMLHHLATRGPIVAAVNAISWKYYLGGVIQRHCESGVELLNHAVEIVGYDLNATVPYYIVKNSWGTRFGNRGYVNVAIGRNVCGIANRVSFIELA